ncbi:MAG: PorV/PorQ family protein [Candidatus Cloacimonadales bacterium]|nr:PorV/PorQ family protein [Candidatus Cloacimonadales bacterium]
MKFRILSLLLLAPLFLMGIDEDAGTTGLTFFKVNYSARAAAMGNAYTGLSNDASAVFFNPAGLVQLSRMEATVTYMSYLDGINCGSMAYAYPLDEKTTFAVFSKVLSATEDKTLVDEYGQYGGTDGSFGFSDIIFGVSVARYLLDMLDMGINVKYLRESIDGHTATAAAIDVGIMHQTTSKNLKVGIALRNIGQQLSYYTSEEYEENLPTIATVGFNLHPKDNLYLTADIYKPLNYDYTGRIGMEFQPLPLLALRAGYKTNAKDWQGGSDDALSGMSFGLGFDLSEYKIKLDYAVVSYGDLGYVNQITLNYIF